MNSSVDPGNQSDLYDHCQKTDERNESIKEGFKDFDEHYNNIKDNAETTINGKKSSEAIIIDIYPVFPGAHIYNDNDN